MTEFSLPEYLTQHAANWRKVGHFALLEEFVLANGKPYKWAEHDRNMGPQKMCFENAAHLALASDLTYVEGFVMRPNFFMAVHHAWVIDDNDTVIDITLRDQDGGVQYMGVAFNDDTLSKQLVKNKVYGLLDTGRGMNADLMAKSNPELVKEWRAFYEKQIERRAQ